MCEKPSHRVPPFPPVNSRFRVRVPAKALFGSREPKQAAIVLNESSITNPRHLFEGGDHPRRPALKCGRDLLFHSAKSTQRSTVGYQRCCVTIDFFLVHAERASASRNVHFGFRSRCCSTYALQDPLVLPLAGVAWLRGRASRTTSVMGSY